MAVLKPGTLCRQVVNGRVCGKPMWPGIQELHLGHDVHGGYIGMVSLTTTITPTATGGAAGVGHAGAVAGTAGTVLQFTF